MRSFMFSFSSSFFYHTQFRKCFKTLFGIVYSAIGTSTTADGELLVHGLMILANVKELSENKRRLFRKKRYQLMKKTNLKRIKNGVYLLPFENPKPSVNELWDYEQIESLMLEFNVKAQYFAATQVRIGDCVTVPSFDDDTRISELGVHLSGIETYFLLSPIKISKK